MECFFPSVFLCICGRWQIGGHRKYGTLSHVAFFRTLFQLRYVLKIKNVLREAATVKGVCKGGGLGLTPTSTTVLKEVLVTLLGVFGALRSDLSPP